MKVACERAPDAARGLASQPTLSRLENLAGWRSLARMGLRLIDLFCESLRTVPGQIVLDIDGTTDRTHGDQQLALFNSHSDGHCFQPIHIYEAATGKPVPFLLRPGTEAARVLSQVIRRIRAHWSRVVITVRGDGHYGAPEVMDALERMGCLDILGLPGNARLKISPIPGAKTPPRAGRGRQAESPPLLPDILRSKKLVTQAARYRPRRSHSPGRGCPLHRHQPDRTLEAFLREGLLRPRTHGKSHQRPQALHKIRSHLMPPLGGQSIQAVSPHRRLLAAARTARRGAKAIQVAHRHIRDYSPVIPQDRRLHRAVKEVTSVNVV